VIVRPYESSLLLITQPDHAGLAERVMRHWKTDGLAELPHRSSIFHAIAEHDNGWQEVDAVPLVDSTGRILDFVSAPIDVRQSLWPRGVERLARDPLAAALVAEHAITVYGRFRSDVAWAAFFSQMADLRARHAAQANVTLDALTRDYFFVRVADLISLAFCNAWTDVQELGQYAFRLDEAGLVIDPDPFAGATIALDVPARRLPARAYSPSEATAAWRASAIEVTQGSIRAGRVR